MRGRLAALSLVVTGVLLVAGCSGGRDTPASPSRSSSPSPSASQSPATPPATGLSVQVGPRPGPAFFQLPPAILGEQVVAFPPRDQSFNFGLQLNAVYRDQLRRSAVSTFVDLEGWIVWVQEYLRYRVNGCTHEQASFRVGVQIGGGGIPPICVEAPPGAVPFPPRDQSFAFGLDLNNTYRDVLRRGTVSAFVDLEGWIVWIQEYLRYRVNNCSHDEASFRVGVQIAGGGVPPTCVATGGGGGSAVIQVRGGSTACNCWVGTITVEIDGVNRGTLTCSGSVSASVSTGSHTVRACDRAACATQMVSVGAGETAVVELLCSSGIRGVR